MKNIIPFRKTPDQATLEAEQAVLGGLILTSGGTWTAVAKIVNFNDFCLPIHQTIFSAMAELCRKGIPSDVIVLADILTESIEDFDSPYLAKLARDTASAENIAFHARIVKRKSLERARVEAIGKDNHDLASQLTEEIKALVSGLTDETILMDYVSAETLDSLSFSKVWLVEGFIESGRVYEFFGRYKSGKTLALIDLAANLSIGQIWAGRRTVKTLVVWVAGEAAEDVKMRVAAWRTHYGLTQVMTFWIRTKPVHLTDEIYAKQLRKEIEVLKLKFPTLPTLVVIDTVARNLAPGINENSIEGLGSFANNVIDHIARPTRAAVICVHHSGHGDSERGRGHSSFEGAVDGIVKVSMDKADGASIITVSSKDMRSTAGEESLSFRVEIQELPGEDNMGHLIEAPVLRYLPDYAPKLRPTGRNECQALAILEQLLATSNDPMTPGVAVLEWRTAFKEWFIAENSQIEDRTAANKAANTNWSRAEKGLHSKGITRYEGINNTRVMLVDWNRIA